MCGIYGIVGAGGPVDRAIVAEMDRRLAHRGPDDSGMCTSPLGLSGMRRLSIIDVSGGHQPLSDESGRIWVTLNGEIYNYRDLRSGLEARGCRFRTASDTEVVANAYRYYGDDFVHELQGMFAISVFDEDRGRVLLARDRIGKKPLYYAHHGGRVLYASEIKALLASPDVDRSIDVRALWHYLTLKNVPAPLTIFSGVRALRAGSILTIERGEVREREYWRPKFTGETNLARCEAAERLHDLLERAVALRVSASDVPVAAFLSGGVDSSLVVAMMARAGSAPLQTFSLGYTNRVGHKNDVAFAREVSSQFGTHHTELELSTDEIVGDLPSVIQAFDEPFAGTTTSYWLSRLIGSRVKVALAGDGADELFGSYADHRMAAVVQHLRSTASRAPEDYGWFATQRDFADRCVLEGDARWRTSFAAFRDEEKLAVVSRDAACDETSEALLQRFYGQATGDVVNRTLEVDCRTLLPDQVLAYADRLSMAHSLEVRSPFLDHTIVEFAGSLPSSYKVTLTETKAVLKDVARRVLPAAVVDRPKEGFVLPIDAWLNGPLAPMVDDLFSAASLEHGLFDAAAVRAIRDDRSAGRTAHTYKLWTLLMFQLWYRLYVQEHAFPAVSTAITAEVAS